MKASTRFTFLFCMIFLAAGLITPLRSTAYGQEKPEQTGRLAIGVRSKTQPFSYKLPPGVIDSDATRGPLSRAGYGGYMIRLCDAALAEMLVDPDISPPIKMGNINVYDIDEGAWVGEKGAVSNNLVDGQQEPAASRFLNLGRKFDILCDAATITNGRRDTIVSPPVFLTGIGYLALRGQPARSDPCGKADATQKLVDGKPISESSPALIGLVGGTTAQTRGLQALVDAREMPEYENNLIAELRQDKSHMCQDGKVLVRTYKTHEDAAKAFCNDQSFRYYVGDLEIIRTYVSAIPGCRFDNGAITYTNDRYAIFGKAVGSDNTSPASKNVERELLVARFFVILNQKVVFNPSILDKAYDDSFPGLPQSRKLKLFYWSIRGDHLPDATDSAPEIDKSQ